jgi:hypothetical protein
MSSNGNLILPTLISKLSVIVKTRCSNKFAVENPSAPKLMLFLVLPSFLLWEKDFQQHFCLSSSTLVKATTKLFENLLPNLEFNSKAVELVTDLNVWLPLTKLMAFAVERPGENSSAVT